MDVEDTGGEGEEATAGGGLGAAATAVVVALAGCLTLTATVVAGIPVYIVSLRSTLCNFFSLFQCAYCIAVLALMPQPVRGHYCYLFWICIDPVKI